MRCAVDGCSPVRSLISFSDTGSGWAASTSSSANMRSSTWMVGAFGLLAVMAAWGLAKRYFASWKRPEEREAAASRRGAPERTAPSSVAG
jgi:hypothetical protein